MIYPQVDPDDWAKHYGISIRSAKCENCGSEISFTIPFAYKRFRGLLSSHTECGDQFRQAVFADAKAQDRMAIKEAVEKICREANLDP